MSANTVLNTRILAFHIFSIYYNVQGETQTMQNYDLQINKTEREKIRKIQKKLEQQVNQ